MRDVYVSFISEKIKKDFELLKSGKFEEKQLLSFIEKAIADLKKDPSCGTKIPRKIWPEKYVKEYKVTNLWKYDLPNAWRLVYTIETNELMIVSFILEWFDHKNYERRFGY
jgi:Txe/YoeB family toxin of Txe-Axe toxin-antitoxin module